MAKLEIYNDVALLAQTGAGFQIAPTVNQLNLLINFYHQDPTPQGLATIEQYVQNIQLYYPQQLAALPELKQYIKSVAAESKSASVMIQENAKGIVISPGQALLILINEYKTDPGTVDELKRLYLSGAQSEADKEKLTSYFKSDVLKDYNISTDKAVINIDPTRRYFETHLSYETLKARLDTIPLDDLKRHSNELYMGTQASGMSQIIAPVLEGITPDKNSQAYKTYQQLYDSNLYKEYTHYIANIRNGSLFQDFSFEDRQKIDFIVASSFMGVINAQSHPLPLNIYGTGYYADANKGKDMIGEQETTRNMNLGLMKGQMPLPQNDIARAGVEMPLLKPSDQATFKEDSLWVDRNFDALVHPFSNSISGTMLCQLRNMALSKDFGNTTMTSSAERVSDYASLFTATMLYGSGGHSLNEFVTPLTLPETKMQFQDIPGFDGLSLESMFYVDNIGAFDAAIDDTIVYQQQLQQRAALNAQIEKGQGEGLSFKERLAQMKQTSAEKEVDFTVQAGANSGPA